LCKQACTVRSKWLIVPMPTPESLSKLERVRPCTVGVWACGWRFKRRFGSLSQTKGKKPEISSPQAVCEVVSAAPPSSQCKLSTFGCFLFFPHSALLDIHPPRVDVVVGPWQWLQRSAHERQGDQLPSLSPHSKFHLSLSLHYWPHPLSFLT
jgi:hypothetical protein